MNAGETENHVRLKTLALAWAQANGFPICAPEVRVPRCGFRADVAAYAGGARGHRSKADGDGRTGDGGASPPSGGGTRTAVFECKQARADLLKDAHAESATRRKLEELTARRLTLEALFETHCPDLRRGETLFPEFDAWDFSGLEHQTYRAVLKELAVMQARIMRGTKFAKMFRYRCADVLYLVVEDGIFAQAELPAGWGVLCRRGAQLELTRPPVLLDAGPEQRRGLLEAIAIAGTRAVNRAAGITFVVPRLGN